MSIVNPLYEIIGETIVSIIDPWPYGGIDFPKPIVTPLPYYPIEPTDQFDDVPQPGFQRALLLKSVNIYDIDGVIDIAGSPGVTPRPEDFIVTGRIVQESVQTLKMLRKRGIYNQVFFLNVDTHEERTEQIIAEHKAKTIQMLKDQGVLIDYYFEDSLSQAEYVKEVHPDLKIIHLKGLQ